MNKPNEPRAGEGMKHAIHKTRMPVRYRNGKWEYREDEWPVRVMAVVEGWAMVRRKGCVPYVVRVKHLAGEGSEG